MDFDGLVEFGELDLLNERNRLRKGVRAVFYLFRGSFKFFSGGHKSSLVQTVTGFLFAERRR